jgi:hypothetical protein
MALMSFYRLREALIGTKLHSDLDIQFLQTQICLDLFHSDFLEAVDYYS